MEYTHTRATGNMFDMPRWLLPRYEHWRFFFFLFSLLQFFFISKTGKSRETRTKRKIKFRQDYYYDVATSYCCSPEPSLCNYAIQPTMLRAIRHIIPIYEKRNSICCCCSHHALLYMYFIRHNWRNVLFERRINDNDVYIPAVVAAPYGKRFLDFPIAMCEHDMWQKQIVLKLACAHSSINISSLVEFITSLLLIVYSKKKSNVAEYVRVRYNTDIFWCLKPEFNTVWLLSILAGECCVLIQFKTVFELILWFYGEITFSSTTPLFFIVIWVFNIYELSRHEIIEITSCDAALSST